MSLEPVTSHLRDSDDIIEPCQTYFKGTIVLQSKDVRNVNNNLKIPPQLTPVYPSVHWQV